MKIRSLLVLLLLSLSCARSGMPRSNERVPAGADRGFGETSRYEEVVFQTAAVCDRQVTAAYVFVIRKCQGFTQDTQARACKAATQEFLRRYPNEDCQGEDASGNGTIRVSSESVRLLLQRLIDLGY